VDTGMGFERVAGIHATTKGFKDFTAEPSNYKADVFAPLFAKITALSGKTYTRTVPTKREGLSEQENTDIAFRVLADHARTISCAIADGILPGNEGRNYVIRRILRRGILYGRKNLGLKTGFFEQLVAPVVESLGKVFPELVAKQASWSVGYPQRGGKLWPDARPRTSQLSPRLQPMGRELSRTEQTLSNSTIPTAFRWT
jgi:alanyl-tRNA synthetase